MSRRKPGSNLRKVAASVSDASMFGIMDQYPDEASAEAYFIKRRWPDGIRCLKCDSPDVYDSKTKRRLTHWKCRDCGHKFTVTSGTVMDGTKLPLRKWLFAYRAIGSAKKGISARQLSRQLGIGLRPAWHLGHRIRASMTKNTQYFERGTVESDETYIGGKRRGRGRGYKGNKTAVQVIVERQHKGKSGKVRRYKGSASECTNECPGQVQSIALPDASRVDGHTVGANLRKHTNPETTRLMTDESPIYKQVGKSFKSHETVDHSKKEYVRTDPHSGRLISTNAAEGFNANLKRQITGTHHSTSQKHLPRYLEEHDHKYNHRHLSDADITEQAVKNMDAGPVRLFKPKQGKADSLIGYSYDEHPKHGTERGMNSNQKRKAEPAATVAQPPVDSAESAIAAAIRRRQRKTGNDE